MSENVSEKRGADAPAAERGVLMRPPQSAGDARSARAT